MNRLLLVGTLLCLSSAGIAQSYTVSPPGYDHVEGLNDAYYFGRYPGGRYQLFDGEYRGKPMAIKGAAYRLDNHIHTTTTAMGRTWSNVQIFASECDMATIKSTFTQNPTTTPTRVFNAAASWPTQTGKPDTLPADWSANFPFSSTFAYTGNKDICLDYTFAGGTLANSGAWAATTSTYYYFDATFDPSYTRATSTELGLSGNLIGCNDRGRPDVYGAGLSLTCDVYSDAPANAGKSGNMILNLNGNYFGLSVPVVTFLGFRSIPNGINLFNVYCNKVYIDTTLPFLSFQLFSNSSGTLPTFDFGGGPNGFPMPPGMGGAELVTQAVWQDKLNKRMLLSSAERLNVPHKPPFFNRAMLSHYDSNGQTGSGPYYNYYYNPIVRYAH